MSNVERLIKNCHVTIALKVSKQECLASKIRDVRKSKISSEMKPVSFWFRMYNCNKSKTNFWFLMYNCNRSKLNILNETFVLYSGGSNSERPISDGRWFSDCSQDHSKPEQLNLAVSLDRFTNKENIYLCLKSSRPTAIYFSSDGTFKN